MRYDHDTCLFAGPFLRLTYWVGLVADKARELRLESCLVNIEGLS